MKQGFLRKQAGSLAVPFLGIVLQLGLNIFVQLVNIVILCKGRKGIRLEMLRQLCGISYAPKAVFVVVCEQSDQHFAIGFAGQTPGALIKFRIIG